jgi:hypothetical protein
MRKNGDLEVIGAYKVTEKGIASERNRPNTFLFKVKTAPEYKKETKPLSVLSLLSLLTTLLVSGAIGYTALKARQVKL